MTYNRLSVIELLVRGASYMKKQCDEKRPNAGRLVVEKEGPHAGYSSAV